MANNNEADGKKRHRWADVIIAFAEGKDIQCRFVTWEWCDVDNLNMINHNDMEWRIKPEKKKGWINIYPGYGIAHSPTGIFDDKQEADNAAARDLNRVACIEIEYEEGEGL